MDVATATTTTFNTNNFAVQNENVPVLPALDVIDLMFELGVWLSGLESFLNIRNHSFAEESRTKTASRDWTIEFRLTHSTLLLCSKLAFQLEKVIKDRSFSLAENDEINLINDLDSAADECSISTDEIYKLSQALKDSVLLNEGLLRAAPLKFGEWTAWCNFLSDKFNAVEAVDKLIKTAEKTGEEFLPDVFRQLLESHPISFAMEADLRLALPRFAKILKWLSVIERMLKNDEPLKTSLLIFSRIYEQIQEMMTYINNRLLRFPNEEDELFGSLDGAAYTASIELRKVYNYELAGLAEIRPMPSVYAKMETAFSLLNDSFQQTLVNFAQLIEPNIEPTKLFPNFQSKLKQSLILRQNLWEMLQSVKKAEQNPESYPMNSLHKQLNDFLNTTLHFLFYKDMETVERFIEEVLITTDKKDLVPILHRFGAYLDTLFGQINMRVVLAKYPFEYPQE
ncbi:MAG: hypothetical protein ACR2MG_03200 [Pyrinomonadaceae bacterium]